MLRRRTPQVPIGTALIGLGATTAAIVGMTLVGAAPAQAAASVLVIDEGVNPDSVTDTQVTIRNETGESVALNTPYLEQNGTPCTSSCGVLNFDEVTFDIVAGTTAGVITITGSTTTYGTLTVTSTQAAPVADSGASSSGPPLVLQQFLMPESGTCNDAASADLNWAGVASGGWGESWAQWANDGAGGAVCSRTLVYNASQGAWEVD